jgi:hypothetical protein
MESWKLWKFDSVFAGCAWLSGREERAALDCARGFWRGMDGLLRNMGVCSGSSGLAAGPLRLADPGFSFCWGRPPLLKACRNTWTGSGPGYAAAGSAAGPGFGAGILCGRRVFSGRLRGSSVEGPDSLLDGASPCGKMPCQLPSFSHGLVLLWLMGSPWFPGCGDQISKWTLEFSASVRARSARVVELS